MDTIINHITSLRQAFESLEENLRQEEYAILKGMQWSEAIEIAREAVEEAKNSLLGAANDQARFSILENRVRALVGTSIRVYFPSNTWYSGILSKMPDGGYLVYDVMIEAPCEFGVNDISEISGSSIWLS